MDPFDLRQWPGFERAGGDSSLPATIEQITIDSRRIYSPHSLFVALQGNKQDGHHFVLHAAEAGARYALVRQDWNTSDIPSSIQLLKVEDPLKAFQDIAKCYRCSLPVKIIGIAGSFGKTMVKDLLAAFLSTSKNVAASPESFNSQIGVPLSLLTIKQEHSIAIIEAGVSKKNEMDALVEMIKPDYSLFTIAGKKHLTTLKNLSTVASENMKLVIATPEQNWKLIPNDPLLEQYRKEIKGSCYLWNQEDGDLPFASSSDLEWTIPLPYSVKFPNHEVYTGSTSTGYSYFLNLINMAVKAAWLMGVSSRDIKQVLDNYNPEPTRTEIWKSSIGTTFINDTYSSDPQSVDHALHHFDLGLPQQPKVFVFGGLRGASESLDNDYKHIGTTLSKREIQSVILYGNSNFDPLLDTLTGRPNEPEITICEDYSEALKFLKSVVHPNSLVLIKGENKQSLDRLAETFNESPTTNQCIINLAAIQSNIKTLRNILPRRTRIMAVVKAFAYGTDEIRMSKFLENCAIDILGVSYVDEGIALKRAGVSQAIFVINAAPYEASKVVKWELEVGVSDKDFIQSLATVAQRQKKQISVHLHINTGMSRFGCRPEEALELAQLIESYPSLKLEGLMTHFTSAENPSEDAFTYKQIKQFDSVIENLGTHGIHPPWIHAANSSGSTRFNLPQYNMVRIGLAIYGLYGSESTSSLDLRLAISLTSRIVGINVCKEGETVGYGRSHTIEQETALIAVIPIGYFDGLHRSYSGKGNVLIRGCKAPMVGKICMDYMMIDVTDIPQVSVGDSVLIFGEDELGQYLSPEELAHSGNSIIYELVTCLGPRIPRVFIYEEAKQVR